MKYFGTVLFFLLTAEQILGRQIDNGDYSELDTKASRSLSAKLQHFLEVDLRDIMKYGDSSSGIPVLDEFREPNINLDVNEDILQIVGKLRDAYSRDLSTYKVRVATFSIFTRKATIGLTFPRIYAEADYEVNDATIIDQNFYGDGKFKATFHDFTVDAVIYVSVLGGVRVKSIDLKIALGELNFNATGIFNDESLSERISQTISSEAPQYLASYHGKITTTLSRILVEVANSMLSKNRINELNEIFA